MATPRHLRNAPIREAIIDFRIKARPGLDPEDLASALPLLSDTFPVVEEQRGVAAEIRFGPTVGAPPPCIRDLGLQGYLLKSEDSLNIAQVRVDGFTFNRVKPYTSWEEILPLAMRAWRSYVEATRPEMVNRLALRYINHILLPSNLEDFDAYLTAGPKIPPGWPQHLGGFLTQVVVHEPSSALAAAVRQSLATQASGREIAVLLDIDAYCQEGLEPRSPEIESILGELRALKNRIFFDSLTETALRLFE